MGILRAYEYQNGSPVAAQAVGAQYRPNLGHGVAAWPPADRAYGGPAEGEGRRLLRDVTQAALCLIVPVLLLLVLLGAAYLYADALLPLANLPDLFRGAGLTIADLILPGAWTCIHLTNRRFGPGYAFAQLALALAITAAVIAADPAATYGWTLTMPLLGARTLLSFAAAFFIANFIAITFFDATRGPRWWTAPLAASFAASFVFSAIYYPAAFAGVSPRWADAALAHAALFVGMSILLLIPYFLLRPAMRPIGGRNGY